jgi:hypothetical protein
MNDKMHDTFHRILTALEKLSPEELDELWKRSGDPEIPKGWVSVNDHLPKWLSGDVEKGFTTYKVRDKDGNEFESDVVDHQVWWHRDAIPMNITHWWKD